MFRLSLKSAIVIVNEYTIKLPGGGGSRGGSPGSYVTRYMSRDGASERIAPVRQDTEEFILRYMARSSAAEPLEDAPQIEDALHHVDRYGGVAFANGVLALSDQDLKRRAKDLQDAFDSGKTVLKTVISFEESYLRSSGCLSDDFSFRRRGDYRGHIDQLKLRGAIDRGVKLMSRHFDDLRYVGVIQVDTAHVHCHLAMADFGKGYVMPDGTQRGKLTAVMKRDFRHGLDLSLQFHHPLRVMASCIGRDKQNTVALVKRSISRVLNDRGFLQVLGAVLPKERGFWRASSNRDEMRRPNQMVRSFVEGVLSQKESGFSDVMRKVRNYAETRVTREGLGEKDYRRFLNDGRENIVKKCMNGVYGVLRKIPAKDWSVHTPMLSVFSTDYSVLKEMPKEDPLVEFGYKLRTYRSRLSHHKTRRNQYRAAVEAYDKQKDTASESLVMREFFDFEAQYQAKLASKYQSLMGFLPCPKELLSEWDLWKAKEDQFRRSQDLYADVAPRTMTPSEADWYGQEVYGVAGGHFLASSPRLFARKLEVMESELRMNRQVLSRKLSDEGFCLDDRGIRRKVPYAFQDVKALDLHHLGYDFPSDFRLPKQAVSDFVTVARERASKYIQAVSYLEQTGQTEAVAMLPGRDVRAMLSMAEDLSESPIFLSMPSRMGKINDGRTFSVNQDYKPQLLCDIQESIVEAVNDLDEMELD